MQLSSVLGFGTGAEHFISVYFCFEKEIKSNHDYKVVLKLSFFFNFCNKLLFSIFILQQLLQMLPYITKNVLNELMLVLL